MFVDDAHWTPVTGVNNSSRTALMAMLGSFDQNPFAAESNELYKFTKTSPQAKRHELSLQVTF